MSHVALHDWSEAEQQAALEEAKEVAMPRSEDRPKMENMNKREFFILDFENMFSHFASQIDFFAICLKKILMCSTKNGCSESSSLGWNKRQGLKSPGTTAVHGLDRAPWPGGSRPIFFS